MTKANFGAAIVACAWLLAVPVAARTQSLSGSPASLDRQERQRILHDLTLLRNAAHVQRFARLKLIVRINGNAVYDLDGVSHPYARPAVRLFVERLSAQHHAACGEKLVVTSLTRPLSEQPDNASGRSVHPAGMAADFRIPEDRRCRRWLERILLALERARVLEATRETSPPHYHVAIFLKPYERYVAALVKRPARGSK